NGLVHTLIFFFVTFPQCRKYLEYAGWNRKDHENGPSEPGVGENACEDVSERVPHSWDYARKAALRVGTSLAALPASNARGEVLPYPRARDRAACSQLISRLGAFVCACAPQIRDEDRGRRKVI